MPSQVRFITASCDFIESCGVVYSPAVVPSRFSEDHYTPLGGGWYHVEEDF